MSDKSDWALVAEARDGDARAFEILVTRYQAPVISFCRQMLGSRQEAEDVAQECFVRVYRALARLTPRAKFSTLLFGIARNLSLNAIRDAKRRGRDTAQSLSRDDTPQRYVSDERQSPQRLARLHEIESTIEAALAKLSPRFREILVLREIQGLDYDTIAEVLKCRKGTVKSRLARAREKLRVKLIELGGDKL